MLSRLFYGFGGRNSSFEASSTDECVKHCNGMNLLNIKCNVEDDRIISRLALRAISDEL